MDLATRLREKPVSPVYDRLDLVSSKERADVERYIGQVRQAPYSGSIVAIYPLPNAHISRADGVLRGVVYVTDGSTPASTIMTTKDLCGGVSIYKLTGISQGAEEAEAFFKAKVNTVRTAKGFCDASLSLEDLVFEGPSLGDINCSWGVFKSIVNMDTLEESWHLVIRSYHAPSSKALYDMIRARPTMTLREVYESKEYNQCVTNADTSRNALAYALVKHFNAKLTDAYGQEQLGSKNYTTAVPLEINRYNVVQRIMNFESTRSSVYAFYAGCYGFAETKPKMVIYGTDRNRGFSVFGYGSKIPQPFGVDKFGYGFPMGNPPASFAEAVSRKRDELIRWGSTMVYHPKSLMGISIHNYHETSPGVDALRTLGYSEKVGSLKLVKKALYISSPDPKSMTIDEIVAWSGEEVKTIAVPKDHEFADSLMYGYKCMWKQNIQLKLHGDVIVSENEHVFVLNVEMVKKIILVCKS